MYKIKINKASLANFINRNIKRSFVLFKRITHNRFNSTYYADLLGLNLNRLLKNEFVPNPKEHIYIETTNICNLGCKFCAYSKASTKKTAMSNKKFFEIVNNATEAGYDTFGLTPIVGEVFVDKNFIQKLNFLENHKKVKNYHFFTNFTLGNKEIVDALLKFKKLKELFISLYGHDKESFMKFTGGSESVYNNLIENLEYLSNQLKNKSLDFELGFGLRTYRSFNSLDECTSKLCQILKDILNNTRRSHLNITKLYYNWGGYITQDDVEGLEITINKPTKYYKCGLCSLILYKNQILADGRINACACRDVDATLEIGDLNTQRFEEIYSIKNKKYIDIIKSQQNGYFNPVCRDCDFYRSIYKYYKVYHKYKRKLFCLNDFYASLNRD
ncbi:MAG: radical SAM protein [Candidatus Hodarchaeota archaeon]